MNTKEAQELKDLKTILFGMKILVERSDYEERKQEMMEEVGMEDEAMQNFVTVLDDIRAKYLERGSIE